MNLSKLLIVLLAGFMVFACDFTPGNVSPPTWESSLIGPISNSKLTLEDLLDFDSLGFTDKIAASEFVPNIGSSNITLPGLPGASVDSIPADTVDISESFRYAIFDSGEIVFEFVNNLPITLNPGQIVNINSLGPNENTLGAKIFDFTISTPLGPGEAVNATLTDFRGLVVSSKLVISVGNISWDDISTPVTFTPQSGIEMKFLLQGLKVREVGVTANNTFTLGDTTPFTFTGGTVPSELESGLLKLKFRNGVPLNISLDLDLVDNDMNVVVEDFLPEGSNLIRASDTSSILIELNQSNVEAFQRASYLISSAVLTDQATIGDTVIINTDSLIGVKAIGQLDLKIIP